MSRSISLVLAPDNTLRFFEYSSISDSVNSPTFKNQVDYNGWMSGTHDVPLNCPHYAEPTTVFRIAITDYGNGSFFAVRYCPICSWVHLPDYFDAAWRCECHNLHHPLNVGWWDNETKVGAHTLFLLGSFQKTFDQWCAERKAK